MTATGNVSGSTAGPPQVAGGRCGAYREWDRNQNGKFEKAEYEAYRATIFDKWDTDQNQRVGRGEFQVCWTGAGWRSTSTAFGVFDDDGDGYLTAGEMFDDDGFAKWDRNHNGVIESEEWL